MINRNIFSLPNMRIICSYRYQVLIFLLIWGISFIALNLAAQTYNNVLPFYGIEVRTERSVDWLGSGISFCDFNQDGWDDLTFALTADTQAIFLNNQGILTSSNLNIFNPADTKMILWVDYDDDGLLDLFYTSKGGQIKLYRNSGNLTLTDVTIQAGLATDIMQSFGASFGDYDRDGDLDLYVCKYIGSGDSTELSDVNNLYRNNGDGTFTDVTFAAGVSNGISPSFLGVR
jgi:hypothetical protein